MSHKVGKKRGERLIFLHNWPIFHVVKLSFYTYSLIVLVVVVVLMVPLKNLAPDVGRRLLLLLLL